jgi:hypothetical protein
VGDGDFLEYAPPDIIGTLLSSARARHGRNGGDTMIYGELEGGNEALSVRWTFRPENRYDRL